MSAVSVTDDALLERTVCYGEMRVSSMNMSVRVAHVHAKSLALEPAKSSTSTAAKSDRAGPETSGLTLVTMIALGLGAVLTIAWAGALLWIAGYLIGFW